MEVKLATVLQVVLDLVFEHKVEDSRRYFSLRPRRLLLLRIRQVLSCRLASFAFHAPKFDRELRLVQIASSRILLSLPFVFNRWLTRFQWLNLAVFERDKIMNCQEEDVCLILRQIALLLASILLEELQQVLAAPFFVVFDVLGEPDLEVRIENGQQ